MNNHERVSRLFGQKIIKKQFQFRFSIVIFSLYLGLACLSWVVGSVTIKHMFEMNLIADKNLLLQLQTLNGVIFKTSALGLVVLYGISLVFSHFIAGPVYRFEQVLKKMGSGNLNVHFKLRRWDEFKDVADQLNNSITNIKEKLLADKQDLSEALRHLESYVELVEQKGLKKEAAAMKQACADIINTPGRLQI